MACSPPPLVSIIIPCYNAQEYVGEAIESALAQSHPHVEVIVVNDGSTDASLEAIKRFEGKIVIESTVNQGGCAARNRGFELARGEWIQFLDADDKLPASKVEKQLNLIAKAKNPGSMAFCGWRHFEGEFNGEIHRTYEWAEGTTGVEFLVGLWSSGRMLTPHCWLTPRQLIEDIGGWDESLAADQDGDFFGRLLTRCPEVVFEPTEAAMYRKPGPSNVSNRASKKACESRFRSWDRVQTDLRKTRSDKMAMRAIHRRLVHLAYVYGRGYPELAEWAAQQERQIAIRDFNPQLPPAARFLVGVFGLRKGLKVRGIFKGSARK